jgi:acetyltransferase-like isoleucine patch superfamily enzyme
VIGERHVVDGSVVLGSGVGIKRECLIHVFGGSLVLEGMCGFSQRCIVHCAHEIRIARWTVVSEYATLVDSLHEVPLEPVARNWLRDDAAVETAPIHVGSHVFVGAKATILKGVTIGDHSIVAANSLVTSDVPPRTTAIGVPARRVPRRAPAAGRGSGGPSQGSG